LVVLPPSRHDGRQQCGVNDAEPDAVVHEVTPLAV